MKAMLQVKDLRKYYPVTKGIFSSRKGEVKAVDGVSFSIREKETLGLVGESGCGKSTLGRALLRLEEPTSGEVYYQDRDVLQFEKSELKDFRRDVQMIFQDPHSSLDPRMTIGDSIGEALLVHGIKDDKERIEIVKELLERVRLDPDYKGRYPHEFSGGQKQRIGIARALALKPKLIIADEPVSALDISVQAQILNLMMDLKEEMGLAFIFIAHDLAVIRHMADRIAVMYLGKIAEMADRYQIFDNPLHPYTKALLSAVPVPDPHEKKERILLEGEVPSPMNPPTGCRFHTRCPYKMEVCPKEEPKLKEVEKGHLVACYLYP